MSVVFGAPKTSYTLRLETLRRWMKLSPREIDHLELAACGQLAQLAVIFIMQFVVCSFSVGEQF